MNPEARKHLTPLLLALGMTLVIAATASAQNRLSADLQVDLGSTPRWTSVRGTHVKEVRSGQRPAYDMFRYGGRYYAYSNSQWYSSTHGSGAYSAIDQSVVPNELSKVPQDHWRNYPANWPAPGNAPKSDRH